MWKLRVGEKSSRATKYWQAQQKFSQTLSSLSTLMPEQHSEVMRTMEMKTYKLPLLLMLFLILSACVSPRGYRPTPLPFEAAVRIMADDLFRQVSEQHSLMEKLKEQEAVFVIDPVIDADTGEVTSTSRNIEKLISAQARMKMPRFLLQEMTSENLARAAYVVSGIMQLEHYRGEAAKLPHLTVSIVNTKSGQVVAHSDAWISNAKLEFEPTPMYRDSPMYIKDKRVDALIATARAAAGSMANREYFDTLATNALLDEASAAYDKNDYRRALGLFAKAAERDDGQVMKTYSGLYQCFYRLGMMPEAEEAFASLTKLGLQAGNISVKFLFEVNKTDFFKNNKLPEYSIWMRQIAKRIAESGSCITIVGHASRSGSEEHNKKLSLKRAERLMELLRAEASESSRKIRTEGLGYTENIIGTGTNDERDAIDRRVEFKVVGCNG